VSASADSTSRDEAAFRHYRVLKLPPERVFDAFAHPDVLAQWWGPNGFTNTFDTFEFEPGGRWVFVMHGPDGSHYPNENLFEVVDRPSRLVIRHVCAPHFVLTVTLAAQGGGTAVTWVQEFEDAAVASRVRHIVAPANEQNLDRLHAALDRMTANDDNPSRLIDARIMELGDWRGQTLARVRALVKEAEPDIVEEWKWRGVPVWSRNGIVCTGETYKNAVKMTFAKGAALEDPAGLFNASLDGNTRRAIDVHEGDEIDAEALKALVRAAVALNKPKPR
jgi:uncharacterized protein YndB with AHSA1/START domain